MNVESIADFATASQMLVSLFQQRRLEGLNLIIPEDCEKSLESLTKNLTPKTFLDLVPRLIIVFQDIGSVRNKAPREDLLSVHRVGLTFSNMRTALDPLLMEPNVNDLDLVLDKCSNWSVIEALALMESKKKV